MILCIIFFSKSENITNVLLNTIIVKKLPFFSIIIYLIIYFYFTLPSERLSSYCPSAIEWQYRESQ